VRQEGSSDSTPYPAIPTTKNHIKNDEIIIGFILEVEVEGIRYMQHHKYGMRKL
jgi:hypothetical protein